MWVSLYMYEVVSLISVWPKNPQTATSLLRHHFRLQRPLLAAKSPDFPNFTRFLSVRYNFFINLFLRSTLSVQVLIEVKSQHELFLKSNGWLSPAVHEACDRYNVWRISRPRGVVAWKQINPTQLFELLQSKSTCGSLLKSVEISDVLSVQRGKRKATINPDYTDFKRR